MPVEVPVVEAIPKLALLEVSGETAWLHASGRFDNLTVAKLWREAEELAGRLSSPRVCIDAAGITYCDGAGVALLLHFQGLLRAQGMETQIDHLPERVDVLLRMFNPEDFRRSPALPPAPVSIAEQVGRATVKLGQDIVHQIRFIGEVFYFLGLCLRHPRQMRWRDALRVAETAGVDALPIVILISSLIGLIMAFQAAIPMAQFGTEIYVADLVALTMLRELGPLMTAIVLAGRSGSAFAAEIGTMKVNDEINALTTMGLEPVRFLVIPRVVAAVIVTPLLTVFSMLAGLAGGLVVYLSLGLPALVYVRQITNTIDLGDPLGGLAKAFVFGILVAAVGCLRGLETKSGASAVGVSTTSAVVSSIVLIAVADGIFAILFYVLGI